MFTRALLASVIALSSVGTGASSWATAAAPTACMSLQEWQQVVATYGGPGTTYDQLQALAGPPSSVTGTTYYSDGTQEFDASFTQCDPNGVPSEGDDVTFYLDNDYGSVNGTQSLGPFKVRYKEGFGPVDVVITSAMAAKDPKYCSVEEFQSLKRRMTVAKVARILDGRGKRTERIGDIEYRRYGKTSGSDTIQYCDVTFRDGRLTDKDRTDY